MVKTETLTNLSKLAKQLNTESDSLNATIEHVNEQLRAMNIGLEFYVRLSENIHKVDNVDVGDYESLGFDKVENQWQLVIKSETRERRPDEFTGIVSEVELNTYYDPLLKASRALRLLAAEHLDSFLEKLTSHVEKKLATVQSAKEKAGLK
jgi:hypothetical protein